MSRPFEPLREDLDAVAATLRAAADGCHAPVDELARYYLGPLGQLLRPGLVLAGAAVTDPAWPACREPARALAVLVELFHSASLLHDDVVDDADLRRGQATVFRRWGDRQAVLLGDLLLARALAALAPHGRPEVLRVVAEITRDLAEGQLLELDAEGQAPDTERYLAIIRQKTATFFGHCAHLGALAAGAPESQARALARFGTSMGMAYQILDDLLDVAGDQAAVGKSVGADVGNLRVTLPVLRLLEVEGPDGPTAQALAGPRPGDPQLNQRIRTSGAFELVVEDAQGWVDDARGALADLPAGPRVQVFEDLLAYLFERLQRLTAPAPERAAAG